MALFFCSEQAADAALKTVLADISADEAFVKYQKCHRDAAFFGIVG